MRPECGHLSRACVCLDRGDAEPMDSVLWGGGKSFRGRQGTGAPAPVFSPFAVNPMYSEEHL